MAERGLARPAPTSSGRAFHSTVETALARKIWIIIFLAMTKAPLRQPHADEGTKMIHVFI